MSSAALSHKPLLGPTAAEWAALGPTERDRLLMALEAEWDAIEQATLDPLACGDPHHDAIEEMRSALRTYYRHTGRKVYVGTDVLVVYPRESPVKPDIIVVLDVEPGPRDSWLVAQEGKGVDLCIEVNNKGDWHKDFVDNVKTYGRLGIPEYFAYAIGQNRLAAHRLRGPGLGYQRILPQAGRFPSQVLGLEVGLLGGKVRFFSGNAQLFPDRELILTLESAVNEAQARAEEAEAQAEQQQTRAQAAVQKLARSVLTILELRGLEVPAAARERILGCDDLALLDRWLARAATTAAVSALFLDD